MSMIRTQTYVTCMGRHVSLGVNKEVIRSDLHKAESDFFSARHKDGHLTSYPKNV